MVRGRRAPVTISAFLKPTWRTHDEWNHLIQSLDSKKEAASFNDTDSTASVALVELSVAVEVPQPSALVPQPPTAPACFDISVDDVAEDEADYFPELVVVSEHVVRQSAVAEFSVARFVEIAAWNVCCLEPSSALVVSCYAVPVPGAPMPHTDSALGSPRSDRGAGVNCDSPATPPLRALIDRDLEVTPVKLARALNNGPDITPSKPVRARIGAKCASAIVDPLVRHFFSGEDGGPIDFGPVEDSFFDRPPLPPPKPAAPYAGTPEAVYAVCVSTDPPPQQRGISASPTRPAGPGPEVRRQLPPASSMSGVSMVSTPQPSPPCDVLVSSGPGVIPQLFIGGKQESMAESLATFDRELRTSTTTCAGPTLGPPYEW